MELQAVSRNLGPCLVCGDTAVGINFSVPTCAPCKAFFRRNAVKLGVCIERCSFLFILNMNYFV